MANWTHKFQSIPADYIDQIDKRRTDECRHPKASELTQLYCRDCKVMVGSSMQISEEDYLDLFQGWMVINSNLSVVNDSNPTTEQETKAIGWVFTPKKDES